MSVAGSWRADLRGRRRRSVLRRTSVALLLPAMALVGPLVHRQAVDLTWLSIVTVLATVAAGFGVRLAYGWIASGPSGLHTSRRKLKHLDWSEVTSIDVDAKLSPYGGYQAVRVGTVSGRRYLLPAPYSPWQQDSDFDDEVARLREDLSRYSPHAVRATPAARGPGPGELSGQPGRRRGFLGLVAWVWRLDVWAGPRTVTTLFLLPILVAIAVGALISTTRREITYAREGVPAEGVVVYVRPAPDRYSEPIVDVDVNGDPNPVELSHVRQHPLPTLDQVLPLLVIPSTGEVLDRQAHGWDRVIILSVIAAAAALGNLWFYMGVWRPLRRSFLTLRRRT